MHIRPTTRADLPTLAHITAAASSSANQPLLDRITPRASLYPQDHLSRLLRKARQTYATPGIYGFVCVSNTRDDFWTGGAEILGFVWWQRLGTSATAAAWQSNKNATFAAVEDFLIELEERYTKFWGLNRARDEVFAEAFHRVSVRSERTLEVFTEAWYLDGLMTAPTHWRRGVGRMLMKWGLDNARSEGVACTVGASPMGRGLYRKLGFQVLDWVDSSEFQAEKQDCQMVLDFSSAWVRPAVGEERTRGQRWPVDVVLTDWARGLVEDGL